MSVYDDINMILKEEGPPSDSKESSKQLKNNSKLFSYISKNLESCAKLWHKPMFSEWNFEYQYDSLNVNLKT